MTDQLTLQGLDPLGDAAYWAQHHPDQLTFVLELWDADKRDRIPPSMDYYWHCLRRSGLVKRKAGEPVACNDRMTSNVARYLRREYGIPFRTREAAADRMERAS
jgi:hypothetical protein